MTLPQKTQDALDHGREGMSSNAGGTMASGPAAVHLVRLITIRSALNFEVNTGMKMSRVSALKAANAALGTNYKRKAQALAAIDAILEEVK